MTARDTAIRALTGIIGTVIALTFLFGFGNVFHLGLRIGVPVYVAPLVAPAVDLSVLGLLIGTRYLALHGASREQLRPARRLLLGASTVTLALNVAEPVCAGQFGKARLRRSRATAAHRLGRSGPPPAASGPRNFRTSSTSEGRVRPTKWRNRSANGIDTDRTRG